MQYLTEKEVSLMLGLSLTTLHRMRENKEIPFVKLRKAVRYDFDALKKWLNQKQKEQAKKDKK